MTEAKTTQILSAKEEKIGGCIMNKTILILAVLLFAAPAWSAGVTITATTDANVVTIEYNNTEPNNVRAFGLDITCNNTYGVYKDANIVIIDVNNEHYWVNPGSIDINDNGTVDSNGSSICYKSQYTPGTPAYNGTLVGPPDPNMTIEMASLYEGSNTPPKQGWLVKFYVDVCCDVNIAGNAIRSGAGNDGVVMEDPCQVVSVTYVGGKAYPPRPACWDYTYFCYGDHDGNAGDPPSVDVWDFFAFKDAYVPSGHNWNEKWSTAEGYYNPCADYVSNGVIDVWDFFEFKDSYTGDQTMQDDCPTMPWPPSGYCGVP
jgi:hypothetical protein